MLYKKTNRSARKQRTAEPERISVPDTSSTSDTGDAGIFEDIADLIGIEAVANSSKEDFTIVDPKPAHESKTIRDNTVVTLVGIVATVLTAVKPELADRLPPIAYGIFVAVLGILNIWRRFNTTTPIARD